MKSKFFIMMILGMLICSSLYSLQLKTNVDASYKEDNSFEEDYLFAGNELEFNGSVIDLFFAGKRLMFHGNTTSGLYAVGETIMINGTIENDCIAAGGTLEISGNIKGTVFAASGECTLSGDSVIDGTLFIAGGNVKLKGTIDGDVYAGSGVLTIDGTVNGNITAGAGEIIITEKGRINGDFEYSTENKLNTSEEQRITGIITYDESGFCKEMNKTEIAQFFTIFGIIAKIIGLVSLLAAGLLLLLLPCLRKFNYAEGHKQFWHYLVWGLIPFFIYPMAIIISMVLIVTIPLGFMLLLAGLPLILLTQVLGITAFGQYLFRLFKWQSTNRFLYFLFGFVFYLIAGLIPIIGILGFIFFSCTGWGIILEKVFKKKFVKVEREIEQE